MGSSSLRGGRSLISAFVNHSETLYGLSHTVDFFCVLLSGGKLVYLIALCHPAIDNKADKVTSPASELLPCVHF